LLSKEGLMTPEELLARIKEQTVARDDGRLAMPCPRAFALAEELQVTIREIGDICHEQQIKITQCQLGCFK
jgi:hypothetical protein